MRRLVLTLGLLAVPALVHAQTTTMQGTWTQIEPPATANTFTYTTVRNVTAPVPITGVVCAASGANSTCSGTITYTGVTIVSGDSFTLTAKSPSGLSSLPSVPFVISGASTPGTFRITITITGP